MTTLAFGPMTAHTSNFDSERPAWIIEGMAKVKRISVAPVRRMAEARGIKTARAFERAIGFSHPTALKWWNDAQEKLDTESMVKLANFFGCSPQALIEPEFED